MKQPARPLKRGVICPSFNSEHNSPHSVAAAKKRRARSTSKCT
ncbi:MAG: hypothetical protein ACQXXJ_04515 [Candidatus Bathyarchaeia archaeon]